MYICIIYLSIVMKIHINKSRMGEKTPYVVVVIVHSIYAVYFLLSKVAFDGGMSTSVFVFYRQAAAALVLCPIVFFSQRKTSPPLSLMICFKIFMLALVGITGTLNLYAIALDYTSPSIVVAASNSLPVIVFFIAFMLKMEKVNLRKSFGILKLVGVGFCLGGVLAMAFYKGPYLKLLVNHHIFSYSSQEGRRNAHNNMRSWIIGIIFVFLSNVTWAMFLVLQNTYPMTSTNKWRIYLHSRRATVITVPASAICFGEVVRLGSVIGTLLLLGGLYSVLWGQAKEQKMQQQVIANCEKASNSKGIEPPVMSSGEGDIEHNVVKDRNIIVDGT